MEPKSIRSSPRAPLGLLWGALGLYFGHGFFNTICDLRNVMKMKQKGILKSGGAGTKLVPPLPLSDSPPLTTIPKGNP